MSIEKEPQVNDFLFWRQEINNILNACPGDQEPDDQYFQVMLFGIETPEALRYENGTRTNILVYPNID